MNTAEFIRQVRQEVAKVTWPTRREAWISTGMVILMVILAAIFFFVIDRVASLVVRAVFGLGG